MSGARITAISESVDEHSFNFLRSSDLTGPTEALFTISR